MRTLVFAARLIPLLPAVLLALSLPASSQTEVITFEDAKSTLIGAMLRNTTWPNESAIDRFVVGFYGENEALRSVAGRQLGALKVRGKPVTVTSYDSLDDAREAQLLVLAPSESPRLVEINQSLRGSQTLVVTDEADDRDNIMVNFTRPSKLRVAFEINAGNIINAGLTPSRELLTFGGSKFDIAEVYAQTEEKLSEARAVASEQQRQLAEQQAQLAEQQAEMAANRAELTAMVKQLVDVQRVLQDSEGRLAQSSAELEQQEQVLAEKEAYIASYTERIEQNLERLEAQQRAIRAQEQQIEEQNSVLVTQLGTIESQRFTLIAIGAVLLLVLVLIGLILRAYTGKHRLALQLEGKTLELGVANEKLLELTEAKSRFLSTMSHEIRTPMNGVIGMAELLEGTDLSSQQEEYVSLILRSADTLLGLINDILDFSKIEAGRLDLEAIPFNLREVLGDTLQTLALRANEKGLELTFHIPPDVPDWLVGDPLRLRQVMVNLVGNAIKFTDAGEVAVDLQLGSQRENDVHLQFEVRDTGIGISEAQQRKIFQAFGQADSSTTRQFGGTGLGLAIAGQLVQMMGGALLVRSEPGEGSTFYFGADFPLPEGPQVVALQPEELQGLRALVVDDNETNRMILEELLVNWGMVAEVVIGGEEALAALERAERDSNPFAIALLDVMMPRMDGFELAARIRQRPDHEAMRILMLTSAGRENTDEIRERLEISRVLLKPTKHSNLQRAITDALGVTEASIEKKSLEVPKGVAPRRVLLVEDNPVNLRVATELLGRRGHSIEVVTNGKEAVEATAMQSFDVVLMDVHMPVMDGLTATRIIRDREHGSGQHLHIVALTAGATVEDRENSLSAGMDSFVTKPFRAEELIQAVEGVAAEMPAELLQEPEPAPSAADEPCLDWDDALRKLEGDEEFLRELAEMFLVQYPGLLTTVEEAVANAAGDELQRAAHALKGSSQVIGGKAAAATALHLENLGRAGKLDEAVAELALLRARLDDLKLALMSELPETQV